MKRGDSANLSQNQLQPSMPSQLGSGANDEGSFRHTLAFSV